jgi:hypothetical protein
MVGLGADAAARAARGHGARQHHDDVGAEAADLFLDARLGAAAHRDHDDHGGDADDDAEHGQPSASC